MWEARTEKCELDETCGRYDRDGVVLLKGVLSAKAMENDFPTACKTD